MIRHRPVLLAGDMLQVLPTLPENHFHSVVCDPPYHLASVVERFGKPGSAPAKHGTDGAFARASAGFMGKSWDGGDIAFDPATWRAVLRVMRPGAYLAAFGGTRTFARMAVAIEDAGFEIRDTLLWLYGTGMPHGHAVVKDIDRKLGQVGTYGEPKSAAHAGWIERGRMRSGSDSEAPSDGWQRPWMGDPEAVANAARRYIPATAEAAAWDGYNTALKPAFEPIVLAQKPRAGTLARNALEWGVGLMNVNGCRVALSAGDDIVAKNPHTTGGFGHADAIVYGKSNGAPPYDPSQGRWPANILTDGSAEVRACFPDASGAKAPVKGTEPSAAIMHTFSARERVPSGPVRQEDDKNAARYFAACPYEEGEGQRFYYSGKVSKADRQGTSHPTTKPTSLMQWVARLVTPAGGTVLDPFAGSGSTGTACIREGFQATLIERDTDYLPMIERRIAAEMGDDPLADLDALLAEASMADLDSLLAEAA